MKFNKGPVSLSTPTFGYLLYVWILPYVWLPPCMFGCLLYIYNKKKACFFFRLTGCPYAAYTFGMPPCMLGQPHMFGCSSYLWMPHTFGGHPNIQGVSRHVGVSAHTEGCPNGKHPNIQGTSKYWGEYKHIGGVQTYRWASIPIGVSKHMGPSKHMGASKHMETFKHTGGASKHTGGIQKYGGHMDTPLSDKARFICVVYVQGYPNVWGHMDTPSLIKHAFFVLCMYRAIQTSPKHRGHPNRGCPNIQGGIWWASKDTGSHPNMRGIQTYGASNIQGASKHMGASKCLGAYGHPLSLTKHAFFVLCMYRGHPNIFCIILNYICHLEFLPSFFFNFKYFIYSFEFCTLCLFLNPELYLPSWISAILFLFLILNILSIPFSFHCVFWNCRKHS